ncbi:hypothetical protein Tco_0370656 [Tanacetum coccineum]
MDKGFLNRISNGSKEVNKGLLEKGSLLGNIAAKVKNINGKILGRDGKPMVARRCVRFSEMTKESACGDGHDVIVYSSKVEHSPQDVANHTNDEPVEHVISSTVCLPMEAIDEIKARFVNTLYGFPVGKRLAFPMVENYVNISRALKEVLTEKPLVNKLILIFHLDGNGYTTAYIRIKMFEWQPPSGGQVFVLYYGDINLEELRNFVDKSMQEESVLEQVGNYDINGCTSREKQGETVSSKKSSSS